jgi:predicted phosphodiesterase
MKSIKNLAEDLIRKFPDTPSLTLARRLFSENPEQIPNLEAARSSIRTVRGANGKQNLYKATIPREHKKPYNPLGLPDSDETIWEPFIIEGEQKIGVFGDVHIPYHHITSLTAFLQWLKRQNPETLLINGDLCDFHGLSRFDKNPKARNLADERKATLQFFEVLRKLFPKSRIILKLGNHDERLEKYLAVKAPELLDINEIQFDSLFKLDNYGIELVGQKRVIRAGGLSILHGHEYPTPVIGPVNAARGLFLRAKDSALVNHHHQVSEHTESTIKGEIITCWSLGCLCELHPAYAPINKWSHGGAIVELDSKGNYEVWNKRILHGKVV